MTTLIERLEAAEAGSRELNALAHAAVVNPDIMIDGGGYRGERTVKYRKMADLIADGFPADHLTEYAPDYTSRPYDLTAAMGLVPEGWHVCAIYGPTSGGEGWRVILHRPAPAEHASSKAATPTLALTAAALRAKEIEDEQR